MRRVHDICIDASRHCTLYNRTWNTDNILVEVGTRICAIASDLIVLVATWSKTYALKRATALHGARAPLATLLLRDGKSWFSDTQPVDQKALHTTGTLYFM